MSRLIDCDERNSFLFFLPLWKYPVPTFITRGSRKKSEQEREKGKQFLPFESLLKTVEMFVGSSFIYKWASRARHEVGDVLKLKAKVPPGRLFGPHCLSACSRWGVSACYGKNAWHSTRLQTSRPADQIRMLCNKLLCPLKGAFGQNPQH